MKKLGLISCLIICIMTGCSHSKFKNPTWDEMFKDTQTKSIGINFKELEPVNTDQQINNNHNNMKGTEINEK